MEGLRRAVVDAGFDTSKPGTHASNAQAWLKIVNGAALAKVASFLHNDPATGAQMAKAYAAAMVKNVVAASVLPPQETTLALAVETRMANEDKVRLAKTSQMDTTTLQTPIMKGEGAAANLQQTSTREERYWASDAAAHDLKTNIGGKSPTIAAQLGGWKTHLINTPADLASEITKIATALADKQHPKPTVKQMEDTLFPSTDSPAVKVETLMGYLPDNEKLDHVTPEVKNAVLAIQGLSPRERGAIYQYTNKLHEQFGYATTSFSKATDFTPQDLQNVTDKLRSLSFMLPIVQALNSALERLPAYSAGPVFSGRKSSASYRASGLTTKTDPERTEYAAKQYAVGSVISYDYPLSSAKDVASSFINSPNDYDVALLIQQPLKTGRDIEYLSNKVNEREVLFPQGVRFRVVAADPQPPGGVTVDATTQNKLWVTVKEI
jgi:hypothetical protein